MNELVILGFPAFMLGAAHALEPGHGKTFILGTLVTTRRPWTAPLFLATATAFGHMVGVLLFATLSFWLAHDVFEQYARIWLEVGIGALAISIGALQMKRALRGVTTHPSECACCKVGAYRPDKENELQQLGGIGLLIGLIPCPSALALAFSTAGLESLTQTLLVAVVFGIGVASTLLVVGLAVTLFSSRIRDGKFFGRFTRLGGFVGPISTIVLGVAVVIHAIRHSHV
jgi:nickel/cobalt exporter